MTKYILGFLTTITLSWAGLINGIAVLVNDTPITLYDIDQAVNNRGLSKDKAVSVLVDDILYKQELKKQNITVDIFDIDKHIDKLASQNKMSTIDFKSVVRQQQDYELFKNQIRGQLLHQKLVRKIASEKLQIATDEDMKIFYDNNIDQFQLADTIEVTAYVSKSKQELNKIKSNPMMQNKNVLAQSITLKQNELNPEVKYVINSTKEKNFSIIFAQNKNYNMFFIKKKNEIINMNFEESKDIIFSKIMRSREKNYLEEYFEILKITANIKILETPTN